MNFPRKSSFQLPTCNPVLFPSERINQGKQGSKTFGGCIFLRNDSFVLSLPHKWIERILFGPDVFKMERRERERNEGETGKLLNLQSVGTSERKLELLLFLSRFSGLGQPMGNNYYD